MTAGVYPLVTGARDHRVEPPSDVLAALKYHAQGRPGKIAVVPTKPMANQRDLSLAYTPGVAWPCLAIQRNAAEAYRYTAKGNLVAVVTNGTAVLGLGNLGALAAKPVMEGKAALFKHLADVECVRPRDRVRGSRGHHQSLPVARTDGWWH